MAEATAHTLIGQESPLSFRQIVSSRESLISAAVLVLITIYFFLRFALQWNPEALATTAPLLLALLFGVPLVYGLFRDLFHLRFGSDLIAGVSILSAVLMQEYLVACVVILMLSGGQALESYATRRASSVLHSLARRMPTSSHLVEGNSFRNIAVDEVRPGDLLLVLPHEICPVDGQVLEGYGRMDESFLTGEPFEIAKAPGAQVISRAINGESLLKIRATKVAGESRYARILRVVQETQDKQPRIRRIGDRLGAWYTPLALLVASLGWALSGDPRRFLAVAVIATPCPLLLAIPIAILGGISLAARRGIVVRNAAVLERIDSCRIFIFDKTGTLTYGRPALSSIRCVSPFKEDEVLAYAASLENYSRHPLARGVLAAAHSRNVAILPPANVSEIPGDGIRGNVGGHQIHITGRSKALAIYGNLPDLPPAAAGLECVVFIDNRLAALMRFQDEPKHESSPFIGHLGPKHSARRVILLSGDKESEVRNLASQVGIDEIYFGQTPEEKLAFVRRETETNSTLFVGDGINDAPAMLAATVGVALGGSSDAISESADAVVLDSSLRNIDELIHVGRRMKSIALQSALGGILLSALGMVAAAVGWLPPLDGAIAQEFIDLAAVLNALRVAISREELADF